MCLSPDDLLRSTARIKLPGAESLIFRALRIEDKPACCAVEDSAFTNPEHRATHEKLDYRISTCSHISYGLFARLDGAPAPESPLSRIDPRLLSSITTEDEDGNFVLLAHVVSTMGDRPIVTDVDMAYPENWRDAEASKGSPLGHQEDGRTVCLHSLAVVPGVQSHGVGSLAVRTYLRVMSESGLCDRIALLCQDYLVKFYERCGFKSVGESKAVFGGGGWHDMVVDFTKSRGASML